VLDDLAFIQTENIHYGLSSRTWLSYQMDVQDDVITVGEYTHNVAMRLWVLYSGGRSFTWRPSLRRARPAKVSQD
jgi:hypothetical protein